MSEQVGRSSGPGFRADGYPIVLVPRSRFCRLHHRLRARLPMWVLYRPITREYSGCWVARMHVTLPQPKPTRFLMTHDTLEELRALLPEGLINIGRSVQDVAEIAEVWV